MHELSRSNLGDIVASRIKFAVAGLGSDKDEKTVVWYRKYSYAELQEIQGIHDMEGDEAWLQTCKMVSQSTFNGDRDEPLFETIDSVGDLPWAVVQALARGIIEANGMGSQSDDTVEKVKND